MLKTKNIPRLIFLISLISMLGSLYYSTYGDPVSNLLTGELFNPYNALPPCPLCWYARILMYPIVIISAVGIYKKDDGFVNYITPLTFGGLFLESYHYSLQMFNVKNVVNCGIFTSCSAIEVKYLGFVTIPFLAFSAFASILALSLYYKKTVKIEAPV